MEIERLYLSEPITMPGVSGITMITKEKHPKIKLKEMSNGDVLIFNGYSTGRIRSNMIEFSVYMENTLFDAKPSIDTKKSKS